MCHEAVLPFNVAPNDPDSSVDRNAAGSGVRSVEMNCKLETMPLLKLLLPPRLPDGAEKPPEELLEETCDAWLAWEAWDACEACEECEEWNAWLPARARPSAVADDAKSVEAARLCRFDSTAAHAEAVTAVFAAPAPVIGTMAATAAATGTRNPFFRTSAR